MKATVEGGGAGESLRYLLSGAGVTAAGTVLITLAMMIMPYSTAYTLVFVVSVTANAYLHSAFVFRKRLNPSRLAWVVGGLLLQYVVGLVGLMVLIDVLGVPKLVAPWLNVAVCTPLNFFVSRLAIRKGSYK